MINKSGKLLNVWNLTQTIHFAVVQNYILSHMNPLWTVQVTKKDHIYNIEMINNIITQNGPMYITYQLEKSCFYVLYDGCIHTAAWQHFRKKSPISYNRGSKCLLIWSTWIQNIFMILSTWRAPQRTALSLNTPITSMQGQIISSIVSLECLANFQHSMALAGLI